MGRKATGNSSLKSASVLRGPARRAVRCIPDQPAGSMWKTDDRADYWCRLLNLDLRNLEQ